MFPTEIFEMIASHLDDLETLDNMRSLITDFCYQRLKDQLTKSVLVVGNIQTGKTQWIIDTIKKSPERRQYILLIQNSLLSLKQYSQRLRTNKVSFQVVGQEHRQQERGQQRQEQFSKVLLLMSNTHRKKQLIPPSNYSIVIDEADLYYNSLPEQVIKNAIQVFYVTATPYGSKFNKIEFNKRITLEQPEDYFNPFKNPEELLAAIENNTASGVLFESKETTEQNLQELETFMLLDNSKTYIDEMKSLTRVYSRKFPTAPVVLLSSEKYYRLNGVVTKIPQTKPLNKIIDMFQDYPRLIIVANRLALRGMSYTSSDYTRTITHQVTTVRENKTNFLQGLRICGTNNVESKKAIIISPEQKKKLIKMLKQGNLQGNQGSL